MTVSSMAEGIGEQKLRDRRKWFRRLVLRGLLLGLVTGVVTGLVAGFSKGWQDAGGGWIGWLVWPVLIVSIVLAVRYTKSYFAQIDELDLLDNLWASLIGFYAVIIAYPCWAILHELDQLPAPDAQALWIGAMAVAAAAYGWRKLRNRF